ncbi:hypothetical protein NAV26_02320 [Pseudomonas stutzeri]|nr:YlcI/YnfO family protein [Stutzerimonas stutzeri]MCQ4323800.1 hypothetical protein [Stutzerimonas stutzeri]
MAYDPDGIAELPRPPVAAKLHRKCNANQRNAGYSMKTATLPSIRVQPELRQAAEAVLKPGETLSSLMEQALRQSIAARQDQEDFIKRGLASASRARSTGRYLPAGDVLATLEERLQQARTSKRR